MVWCWLLALVQVSHDVLVQETLLRLTGELTPDGVWKPLTGGVSVDVAPSIRAAGNSMGGKL